jgi:hypothetical protein
MMSNLQMGTFASEIDPRVIATPAPIPIAWMQSNTSRLPLLLAPGIASRAPPFTTAAKRLRQYSADSPNLLMIRLTLDPRQRSAGAKVTGFRFAR